MAPDSTRNHERSTAQHYTMKTSSRPPLTTSHSHHSIHSRHSQLNSQAHRANRSTTTPLASPRMPHSVGQPHPPTKLSPGIKAENRSTSPNYFGFHAEQHSPVSRDSNTIPQGNWSPPSSSVKSFAAAIPTQVPLDANPEYEAFKRQADANRTGSFSLGGHQFAPMQPPTPSTRPKPRRLPTGHSDNISEVSLKSSTGKARDVSGHRMDVDADSLHDSAYVSSDSKRNSQASMNPPAFSNAPRFESPAQVDSPFEPVRRSNLSKSEERHPRLSLPLNKLEPSASEPTKPRSETLPSTLESGPGLILASQLKEMLQQSPESEYLLLDVRVSTQYAQSRIRGSLNLCIPTTLLKRATFNLDKLQKTLQIEEDQQKFAQWSEVKYLVVYDASSNEKRDAASAVNMLKKFTNQGFSGHCYILRGGFQTFSHSYPELVDQRSGAERAGNSSATCSEGGRPTFAPVIGGVMLPATANDPNPFFNNIRQNMDLADGVGQLDIGVPPKVDLSSLPTWLHDAAKTSDHGKKVSEKFLGIERNEQFRMKGAYSAFNTSDTKGSGPRDVRLSGVEKGVKNRYKDILPFEHARVRLADRAEGDCDYINASHIKASRSNKRYIASQGPLPATFEDFWSVIWDQDIRVIVMLTAESEGGQLKCHPYWSGKDFGPIKLRPLSEKKVSLDIDKPRTSTSSTSSGTSNTADVGRRRANTTTSLGTSGADPPPLQSSQSEAPFVVIRKFALSHAAHPFAPMREVTHLYYPSWPDFGAPAQPSHLLALVELANVMQRAALPVDANAIASIVATDHPSVNWYDEPELEANPRPMLVHCSAGCGRTGTFCTVDSVIDMMKRQRLASVDLNKGRDADGDVSMGDGPESTTSAALHSQSDMSKSGFSQNATQKTWAGDDTSGDNLPSWVTDGNIDLVANTVEDFRGQRLSMVQSLRQFVLCYETVLEWVWRFQEKNSRSATKGRMRSGSLEGRR